MFYAKFIELCSEKGVSPSKAGLSIGVSKTSVGRWKDGVVPKLDTLNKLAKYFDVSTDYLLGHTDIKKKSPDELTYDDFSYAMYEHSGDLTDSQKAFLLNLAKEFVKEKQEEIRKE